jgi:type III pantothenate kinase
VLGAVGRSFLAAREILGETPRLLLAGGDAARVAAALDLPTQQRPDLVIEGLAILAKDTEE